MFLSRQSAFSDTSGVLEKTSPTNEISETGRVDTIFVKSLAIPSIPILRPKFGFSIEAI